MFITTFIKFDEFNVLLKQKWHIICFNVLLNIMISEISIIFSTSVSMIIVYVIVF